MYSFFFFFFISLDTTCHLWFRESQRSANSRGQRQVGGSGAFLLILFGVMLIPKTPMAASVSHWRHFYFSRPGDATVLVAMVSLRNSIIMSENGQI